MSDCQLLKKDSVPWCKLLGYLVSLLVSAELYIEVVQISKA
jgi:hypothetical protein